MIMLLISCHSPRFTLNNRCTQRQMQKGSLFSYSLFPLSRSVCVWIYICVCVCIIHVPVSAHECVNAHPGGRSQRPMAGVFLNCFPPYSLRQTFSLKPGLINLSQKTGQQAPEILSSLPFPCKDGRCILSCYLFMWAMETWTQELMFVCLPIKPSP